MNNGIGNRQKIFCLYGRITAETLLAFKYLRCSALIGIRGSARVRL
jgi:hypothetical protein